MVFPRGDHRGAPKKPFPLVSLLTPAPVTFVEPSAFAPPVEPVAFVTLVVFVALVGPAVSAAFFASAGFAALVALPPPPDRFATYSCRCPAFTASDKNATRLLSGDQATFPSS